MKAKTNNACSQFNVCGSDIDFEIYGISLGVVQIVGTIHPLHTQAYKKHIISSYPLSYLNQCLFYTNT